MANLLAELGWLDVQEYLRQDDRLIFVVGSTEQHGRHMAFASDVWQPWEIACRLSERTGVLLAPPVNYGMSLHHLGFPGSLSLRPHTLTSIIVDLLESAYQHGFRRIFILNGHGGNAAPIQMALVEAVNELPGLQVRAEAWWRVPEIRQVFERAGIAAPSHADAGETSVVLAIRPDVVRLDRAEYSPDAPKSLFLTKQVFQEFYPHGVIGTDPRRASAKVGEQVLTAAVQEFEKLLGEWMPGI
jgi:creatinine amidohydrolase